MSNNPDYKSVVSGVISKELKDLFDPDMPAKHAKGVQYTVKFFDGLQPVYFRQDKFTTIATLVTNSGQFVASAVARRNPVDEQNDLRGKALALSRAVRHAYNLFVLKPLSDGMELVVEPDSINQAVKPVIL